MPANNVRRMRPKVPSLSPGDTIDYSLTTYVKHPRHGEWWIKSGGTTTVRDGESPLQAKERLKDFVQTTLEESVAEVLA